MARTKSILDKFSTFGNNSTKSSSRRPTDTELRVMIEKKAYELYAKRGNSHGNDLDDWLKAEGIVKRQYNLK